MRHTTRPQRVLLASLAFCLAASNAGGQQARPPAGQGAGELKLYDFATQIGTAASRTFRDSLGRVSKVIYYSAWGSTTLRGPFREQDLRLQSTDVLSYDANGRHTKTESTNSDGKLERIRHDEYGPDGQRARILMTNGDGVKTLDTRYGPTGGRITELHYDVTGQFVVGIRGVIPPDVDLPQGWGDPINGFACAIVLTRERGRIVDIAVSVNLKSSRPWPTIAPGPPGPLPNARMVLRNAQGTVFPEALAPPRDWIDIYRTQVGAGFLYPAFPLRERFPALPPGRYTLRVEQSLPFAGVTLLSNEVTVVVQ